MFVGSLMMLLSWCIQPAGLAQGEGNVQQAPNADFYVELQTTRGPIILKIFYSKVPYTAGHFLNLLQKHFYDGLSFHRVEYWVIQGGDPRGNGTGSYLDPETGNPVYIKLETSRSLRHVVPGMVAMARGADINSASCQFYITKKAMPSLDGKYAVFGQVVRGIEHVFEIERGDRILQTRILGPEQQAEQQESVPRPATQTPSESQTEQQVPLGDPGF
jgi:peptidyl-prolyl cis-trans isomerase B (cyclophilin B)